MSTMPVTWYVAKCDKCGRAHGETDYETDDDGTLHWPSRGEAIQAAIDDGWHLFGTHQPLIACPECSECERCQRKPAWTIAERTRCADHRHRDSDEQLHLTIDDNLGSRSGGTATFTPAAPDDKFIEWPGPVHIPTPHDILGYLDMGDMGYVMQCGCKQWFTGDDENAAREEHAAHVDRVTRRAGQDPVLYHARNPYLPAHSKGHNRLDLIEIDGQPARPRAWWRRLLRWS